MDEIPEIPLVMDPQTPEARSMIGFKWTDAGGAHKLGGRPEWKQEDETPDCLACSKRMTFYGQLDCLGDEVSLGDCGRIYVFVCLECLTTHSILQCA